MALSTLVDIGRLKEVLFSAPGPNELPANINGQLARLARAATEEVELRCRRRFVPVAGLTSRYYPRGDNFSNIADILAPLDPDASFGNLSDFLAALDASDPGADAITVTLSQRDGAAPVTLVANADYVLELNEAGTAYDLIRYYRYSAAWACWNGWWGATWPGEVAVTATHGYSRTPPETIVEVAEAIAVRLYNLRRFAYQGGGGNNASAALAPDALWDELLLQRIEPYARRVLVV